MRFQSPESYDSYDSFSRSASPSRSPPRRRYSFTPPRRRETREEGERREERETNVQDLPPFFPSRYEKEVPLPSELVNEPFSFFDNGLRPEIVKPRPKFRFEIEDNGVVIVTTHSGRVLARPSRPSLHLPEKRSTNVSVATVYDTYGLEVTYSFLKHVYKHKYQSENKWLLAYLEGSLLVLWPESEPVVSDNSPSRILYLCCQIMRELEHLESKLLKMLAPVQASTTRFPDEVLAKILGSERVSKQIASEVRYDRCRTMPTLPELEAEYQRMEDSGRDTGVILLDEDAYVLGWGSDEPWSLERDGDDFIFIRWNERTDMYARESQTKTYPLDVYAAVFKSRGCSEVQSVIWMLEDIVEKTKTVNESNIDLVCSWFLQLSFELNKGRNATFSMEELGQQLQVLLRTVIERYR